MVVATLSQRLQEQVNDIIDLHQNAVDELRGQLAQVENMTVSKTQDLEEVMDDYKNKVGVGCGLGLGVASELVVMEIATSCGPKNLTQC